MITMTSHFQVIMAMLSNQQKEEVASILTQSDEIGTSFVDSHITQSLPQEFLYEGHSYTILQGVFHSGMRERPSDFVGHLPVWGQTRVLEVGCGNGCMTSAYYLRHHDNVDHVTALDINPAAVNNTRINFRRHHVPGEVILSDLFTEVKGQLFDLIFWNAPWKSDELVGTRCQSRDTVSRSRDPQCHVTDSEMLELALTDPGYKVLYRYICEVRGYLTERGRAFICMGLELSDIRLLNDLATKAGCRLEVTGKSRMKGAAESAEMDVTCASLEILPLMDK